MKKRNWFRSFGWIHYPISWQGMVLAGIAIIFCVTVFTAVDRNSHSVSDIFYGVFPFWVPAFLLLEWIASKKSKS